MKFHFIAAHRAEFRVRRLCQVLGVSPSGFYTWARRPVPRQTERNAALLVHIQAAYTARRRTYGAPRIHQELQARGVAVGRHRIARLMRREGIVACTERRFRWTATARAELPAAPDRLRRDFTAAAPNQRWVSDITSVRTSQGWLHLAIVLDRYARRIVGWAMAPLLDQALAAEALAMALADRRPAPGLLVHSDRGGPYLATRVQQQLTTHRAIGSTSRPGRCLDNAVAESFFHTLKRRGWRSSSTSRPSTTAPVGTRAMAIAHPTSTSTPWGNFSRLHWRVRPQDQPSQALVPDDRVRPGTSLLATTAKSPSTRPETKPITGPTSAIIRRGLSGSGIEAIMAASLGWFAM